jgi:rRNA maturation RNase YbeY
VRGEIFICIDDVIANARRFGVNPQSELLRCVVHGALHLLGFDDKRPADRRKMKRKENLLLRKLSGR